MEHKTSQEYSWITSLNCQHLDTNAFSYFLLLCQSACAAENMPTACGHTHNNQACVSFSSVEVKKLSHACSSLFSGAQEFLTKKMVFPLCTSMDIDKSDLLRTSAIIIIFYPNMAIMRSTWAEHSTFFSIYRKRSSSLDLLDSNMNNFLGSFTKSQAWLEPVSLKTRVMPSSPFSS